MRPLHVGYLSADGEFLLLLRPDHAPPFPALRRSAPTATSATGPTTTPIKGKHSENERGWVGAAAGRRGARLAEEEESLRPFSTGREGAGRGALIARNEGRGRAVGHRDCLFLRPSPLYTTHLSTGRGGPAAAKSVPEDCRATTVGRQSSPRLTRSERTGRRRRGRRRRR